MARPIVARPYNERLQALINEAGCSNVGLARRVNVNGAERGLDLRYDKTSVSRWLRGQQPRGATPQIIAEVLGQRIGRSLSVEDIGMANGRDREASLIGLAFPQNFPHAVEQATQLWRSDAGRRNLHTGSRLSLSALLEPCRDWLITEPDADVSREGDQPVVTADIELMVRVTRHLADLDHRFGGGRVRPIAVHYLNSIVSGLLTGSYRGEVGLRLCSAAARLTELVGYMAVDTGKAGLAQRYYIQALRLAQAGGDREYGGYVLAAGMSHLAASLGFPREVVQLARAAQEGTRGSAGPRTQACLFAAEARGYALLGDEQAFDLAAGRAADALERADPPSESSGIIHIDQAYLAGELARCYVDLNRGKQAVRKAEEALSGYPEHRVRRRSIDLLLLASAQVQNGTVDEACATATQAVTLLAQLRSSLSLDQLRTFRSRLKPFGRVAAVRDLEAALDEAEGRTIVSRSESNCPV